MKALQRISLFSKKGQFIAKWGTQGTGDGEFDRPAFIAFDNEDNLLVSDGLNNRIQRYTKDGRFLNAWGSKGAADGEFDMPWGIAIDRAGDVYVADWRNDRVQKFDAEGKHLASWGVSGQGDGEFSRPAGVAVDPMMATSTLPTGITIGSRCLARTAALSPCLGASRRCPNGPRITSRTGKTTRRKERRPIVKPDLDPLTYDDTFREEAPRIDNRLWAPTLVKLDDEGNIYVVDSCRYRVQVYSREPQSLKTGATVAAPATV